MGSKCQISIRGIIICLLTCYCLCPLKPKYNSENVSFVSVFFNLCSSLFAVHFSHAFLDARRTNCIQFESMFINLGNKLHQPLDKLSQVLSQLIFLLCPRLILFVTQEILFRINPNNYLLEMQWIYDGNHYNMYIICVIYIR